MNPKSLKTNFLVKFIFSQLKKNKLNLFFQILILKYTATTSGILVFAFFK